MPTRKKINANGTEMSNFKSIEFDGFRNQAGLHSFSLIPKVWVQKNNAIGLYFKAGIKYWGCAEVFEVHEALQKS